MYTQQFIKSVKKIFLWYLYGRFREQIFKKSTILDKNIETFIKIRQIWKPSVNRLTASYRKSLTVPENRLTNPSPDHRKTFSSIALEEGILPFATTYLAEREFCDLVTINNKSRNRLYISNDLRLGITNIMPILNSLLMIHKDREVIKIRISNRFINYFSHSYFFIFMHLSSLIKCAFFFVCICMFPRWGFYLIGAI